MRSQFAKTFAISVLIIGMSFLLQGGCLSKKDEGGGGSSSSSAGYGHIIVQNESPHALKIIIGTAIANNKSPGSDTTFGCAVGTYSVKCYYAGTDDLYYQTSAVVKKNDMTFVNVP